MTEEEILQKLTGILADLLFKDDLSLTMQTRREDVDGWDSFAYINFIVAVEMSFNVKFRVADVDNFEDVGAVVRKIQSLLS